MEQILLEARHIKTHERQGFDPRQPAQLPQSQTVSDQPGGVTALVDMGTSTNVIYLYLCKAFGMVPHDILVSTLERDEYEYVHIHEYMKYEYIGWGPEQQFLLGGIPGLSREVGYK